MPNLDTRSASKMQTREKSMHGPGVSVEDGVCVKQIPIFINLFKIVVNYIVRSIGQFNFTCHIFSN